MAMVEKLKFINKGNHGMDGPQGRFCLNPYNKV